MVSGSGSVGGSQICHKGQSLIQWSCALHKEEEILKPGWPILLCNFLPCPETAEFPPDVAAESEASQSLNRRPNEL